MNLRDKFRAFSYAEFAALDNEIKSRMKEYAGEGMSRADRARHVSEAIHVLLQAAPLVAAQPENSNACDAVEEAVGRWTGYLHYHGMPAPAALLPPALKIS